jgi:hypothetical protein
MTPLVFVVPVLYQPSANLIMLCRYTARLLETCVASVRHYHVKMCSYAYIL